MRVKSRSAVVRVVVFLKALLLTLSVQAQPGTPVIPPPPEGLHTVEFYSPAVDRTMKYDVVLPPGYEESDARYPVLYLLHGYMQNYTVWGRNLGAAFYARSLENLILLANEQYGNAQSSLRDGDWTAYGQQIEALQSTLEQLMEVTGMATPTPEAPASDVAPDATPVPAGEGEATGG